MARHNDTTLVHNDTSLRHNDLTIQANDTSLSHKGGVGPSPPADALILEDATYTGDGAADLDFSTGPDLITRVGGSFVSDGFDAGTVTISASVSNNGDVTVTAVNALTLEVADTLVGELNVAANVTQVSTDRLLFEDASGVLQLE